MDLAMSVVGWLVILAVLVLLAFLALAALLSIDAVRIILPYVVGFSVFFLVLSFLRGQLAGYEPETAVQGMGKAVTPLILALLSALFSGALSEKGINLLTKKRV